MPAAPWRERAISGSCTLRRRRPGRKPVRRSGNDIPDAPRFDTTIVRSAGCKHHLLHFPSWGTGTTYKLNGHGVEREVGFMTDNEEKQWLDITDLPVGSYNVNLLACGNGGSFTLTVK